MVEDCAFCKLSNGEMNSKKIYENRNFFSIFDVNPKIEGHSLVISKKHFKTSLDVPSSLGQELLDCIKNTSLILIDKFKATGFNIVQNNFPDSGQTVDHVHFHIMPRKKGDKVPYCY